MFYNRVECFFVVNRLNSIEIMCNDDSFISINGSIRLLFDVVNLFIGDNIPPWLAWNKSPSLVVKQGPWLGSRLVEFYLECRTWGLVEKWW